MENQKRGDYKLIGKYNRVGRSKSRVKTARGGWVLGVLGSWLGGLSQEASETSGGELRAERHSASKVRVDNRPKAGTFDFTYVNSLYNINTNLITVNASFFPCLIWFTKLRRPKCPKSQC